MFVDPTVCRKKFDREIADFRQLAAVYHRRGIWLIDAAFPEVFVVLVAVHPKPFPQVALGVVLNFEDYDVRPPSVQFVNPITKEPLKKNQIPTRFKRLVPFAGPNIPVGAMVEQELLQGYADDAPAFICLQGVREYHQNPGHTGDSWFLYRKTGVGTLANLLDILSKYGTEPIRGVQINLGISGFNFAQAPQ